jgi:hypothetical protein
VPALTSEERSRTWVCHNGAFGRGCLREWARSPFHLLWAVGGHSERSSCANLCEGEGDLAESSAFPPACCADPATRMEGNPRLLAMAENGRRSPLRTRKAPHPIRRTAVRRRSRGLSRAGASPLTIASPRFRRPLARDFAIRLRGVSDGLLRRFPQQLERMDRLDDARIAPISSSWHLEAGERVEQDPG